MCWLWREPSPAPGTLATKGLGPVRTQRPPWQGASCAPTLWNVGSGWEEEHFPLLLTVSRASLCWGRLLLEGFLLQPGLSFVLGRPTCCWWGGGGVGGCLRHPLLCFFSHGAPNQFAFLLPLPRLLLWLSLVMPMVYSGSDLEGQVETGLCRLVWTQGLFSLKNTCWTVFQINGPVSRAQQQHTLTHTPRVGFLTSSRSSGYMMILTVALISHFPND